MQHQDNQDAPVKAALDTGLDAPSKRPYAAPELQPIDSVQGLTQAGPAGLTDAGIFS